MSTFLPQFSIAFLITPPILEYIFIYKYLLFFVWHYGPYLNLVLLCVEVSYSQAIRHTVGLL
jgi:hypothetical protein